MWETVWVWGKGRNRASKRQRDTKRERGTEIPEKRIPPCEMTVPVVSAELTCHDSPTSSCGGTHRHTRTCTRAQVQSRSTFENLKPTEIRNSQRAWGLTAKAFTPVNGCWQRQWALDFKLLRLGICNITARPSSCACFSTFFPIKLNQMISFQGQQCFRTAWKFYAGIAFQSPKL